MAAGTRGFTVVGLDLGTTNLKAARVKLRSAESGSRTVADTVAVRSCATPEHAGDLVARALRLVRDVLADPDHPDRSPAAVGISSMAETGVPLGAADEPLTALLTWHGGRDPGYADRLREQYGAAALFAATGVRAAPKTPLATWAWLRDTHPAVWSSMRSWAGAADLVCHALTGRLATDHTLAGRTMAYRLPTEGAALERQLDPDLLAAVGMRPEQFPDVLAPTEIAGRTHRAAGMAGLPAGVPVAVAGHDHQVGAYATGLRAPGDAADSLGTTEAVLRVLETRPDPARVLADGMSLVRTVDGVHDALLAGSSSAGAAYSHWLAEHSLETDEQRLLRQARRLPPGPTELLVLPYLRGRQCPAPDPAARMELVGAVTGPHAGATLLKALCEGLSLQTRWMYDAQLDLAGPGAPDEGLSVFGGAGSDNPLWREVRSAVLPVPLRLAESSEPVATGAAVVAAERAGLVRPGSVELPTRPLPPPAHDTYGEVYARFVAHARRSVTTTHRPGGNP